MVVPGFLGTDRTTLELQRGFAGAGWRVTGWGLGLNSGFRSGLLDDLGARIEAFAAGRKVVLVGWSLGGVYAREIAKLRPELIDRVVTMGTPFSGDPHANNAWRLYERIAGHPVDRPPIAVDLAAKPPVPTLALWSRGDGIVAPASARGAPGESDRRIELDCTHMGFAVSRAACRRIVALVGEFAAGP
jgi:pimeloyl-ACP methyl ester carboxylesterase